MSDDEARDSCMGVMRELIRVDISTDKIRDMERACWEFSRDVAVDECAFQVYYQACAKVVSNLTESPLGNDNEYLWKEVAQGRIDGADIISMGDSDLDPRSFARSKNKCFSATNLCESDQFSCPRCKCRRSVHYELQTRSADEATTVFVACLDCGHKWTE